MALQDSYWSGTASDFHNTSLLWSKFAQTFTTANDSNYNVSSIGVSINVGVGSTTIYAEIQTVDGTGYPTGVILSSGSIAEGSVNNQPYMGATVETAITVSSYTLVKNTKYALVLYPAASTLTIWGAGVNGYGYGNFQRCSRDTGVWVAHSPGIDTYFRIYGTDVTPGGDLPFKPKNPVPGNASTSIRLNLAQFSWEAGTA